MRGTPPAVAQLRRPPRRPASAFPALLSFAFLSGARRLPTGPSAGNCARHGQLFSYWSEFPPRPIRTFCHRTRWAAAPPTRQSGARERREELRASLVLELIPGKRRNSGHPAKMRSPRSLSQFLWAAVFMAALCSAASSHSLRYFFTGVSEPGQGLPQFIAVGYVDDQPIEHYDSNTRKDLPRVPWMEKVDVDDPQYWERGTQISRNTEQAFRENLVIAQKYYNQSGGLHTLQRMYGCELRSDGSKGGYFQDGYDGRDYLSLDKETRTWTAADAKAQLTKWKWEAEPAIAERYKAYLEETCIMWLRRYLEYGKETLQQRTEPPEVKVTRHKSLTEDTESLVCQAHGFYPKEIEVTWTRDGESCEHETFRRRVAPNPDGTYYIWICIDIDPEERGRYRCRVDHAGLSQPLVLAWEGPAGNVGLVVGVITGALVLLLLVVVTIIVVIVMKKLQDNEFHKPQLSPFAVLGVSSVCRKKVPSESSVGSEKALLDKA